MTSSIPTGVSAFVQPANTTLHVRLDGPPPGSNQEVPILYLHSLGADLRIFDGVVVRLPGRTHLRMDLRGHGLSDSPAGAYTIQQLAADALGVVGAAGADRVVLVGVSVGGMVALRAALDYPDRVAGLVLSNTAAKIGEEDVWRARIETVEEQSVGALADSTLLRWFPEPFRQAHEPLVNGFTNMIARTSLAGYAGVCAALGAEDLRHRLHELQVPTLVVGGTDDLSTPPPLVAELAAALPKAELQILNDAGHLPMVDAAEAFTALLSRYLKEHVMNDEEAGRG